MACSADFNIVRKYENRRLMDGLQSGWNWSETFVKGFEAHFRTFSICALVEFVASNKNVAIFSREIKCYLIAKI